MNLQPTATAIPAIFDEDDLNVKSGSTKFPFAAKQYLAVTISFGFPLSTEYTVFFPLRE